MTHSKLSIRKTISTFIGIEKVKHRDICQGKCLRCKAHALQYLSFSETHRPIGKIFTNRTTTDDFKVRVGILIFVQRNRVHFHDLEDRYLELLLDPTTMSISFCMIYKETTQNQNNEFHMLECVTSVSLHDMVSLLG